MGSKFAQLVGRCKCGRTQLTRQMDGAKVALTVNGIGDTADAVKALAVEHGLRVRITHVDGTVETIKSEPGSENAEYVDAFLE